LVRYSDAELRPLIETLGGVAEAPLAGYSIRIADGNLLGLTDHRLAVLRPKRTGALPGKSIAGLAPQAHLVSDVFPCKDAHVQERSLFPGVLATVSANQVWIADRNFCTAGFLCGIAERQGYFVIRAHQNLPWQALAPLNPVGDSATVTVSEQPVPLTTQQGHDLLLRRVVVRLNQPTRHGDWEAAMPVPQFAQTLTDWAAYVDLKRFASSPREPKKPPQKDALNRKQLHVTTARLLKEKENKRSL
jgi:hypothetical protein